MKSDCERCKGTGFVTIDNDKMFREHSISMGFDKMTCMSCAKPQPPDPTKPIEVSIRHGNLEIIWNVPWEEEWKTRTTFPYLTGLDAEMDMSSQIARNIVNQMIGAGVLARNGKVACAGKLGAAVDILLSTLKRIGI
jgi:hypothetical protein